MSFFSNNRNEIVEISYKVTKFKHNFYIIKTKNIFFIKLVSKAT